jgi:putative methionine-R-sulfoxide reductase with GAF domain
MNIPSKRQVKRSKSRLIVPIGKNGKCITVVKGNGSKPKPLTKAKINELRIKQTLERKVW